MTHVSCLSQPDRRPDRGPDRRPDRRPEVAGFTLLELIITMAIIALLVGLVLLVVGPVVESAKRATCASNLRQWGVVVMTIRADNRGLLPEMSMASGASSPISIIRERDGLRLSNPLLEEYSGFAGDGAVERLAPFYRCPSNPTAVSLEHWRGYGWFSIAYSYFGRSDSLISATVIGQESLCVRIPEANNLLMQDGIYSWWVNGDSWSFNHAENRAPSSNGQVDCWKGLPQTTGRLLPANGINQLWGDGRVAWRTLDKVMRSDVSNSTLWGKIIAYGEDYHYFPRAQAP